MSDDEQNNSNEKPNPLTGAARRRKPFTRMIDVSDQFMYETFEVGADLSGDELKIEPSNATARPEEPPEATESSSGLSTLLTPGAQLEEDESPQTTALSSLLQSTGEFVRPTKPVKQPLGSSSEAATEKPPTSGFGALLGGAQPANRSASELPEPPQTFTAPPAFGLPPAHPPQQPTPMYSPQPGKSPLPVLPKYVPTQKSAPAQPAANHQQASASQAPSTPQAKPGEPAPLQQQPPQTFTRHDTSASPAPRPAQPARPASNASPQLPPQQSGQPVPTRPAASDAPVVKPAAQATPPVEPRPPVPPQPGPQAAPRVASSLTPGLGFEVPPNPFGRLTEPNEPSQSNQGIPAQRAESENNFAPSPFSAPQTDETYEPKPYEPKSFVPDSFRSEPEPFRPEPISREDQAPAPPVQPQSGRPPEPPAKPSGLMGSLQPKSSPGLGLGRTQPPFTAPSGQNSSPPTAHQAPHSSSQEEQTDLDDLIFNSEEPNEPPTSNQTSLSARHKTVRRADFTRPRIPQLDPKDSDVVAASQSEEVGTSATHQSNRGNRPGRPKPKRSFMQRLGDFFGQMKSAVRKLFKDED